MKQFALLLLFWNLSISYGQLIEGRQELKLIEQNVCQRIGYNNGEISSIAIVNRTDSIVTTYLVKHISFVKDSLELSALPRISDTLVYSTYFEYFFNKNGSLDSSSWSFGCIKTEGGAPILKSTIRDVFFYKPDGTNLIIRKKYFIESGIRRLQFTFYYGYDEYNRLLFSIRNDGDIKTYYMRDVNGSLISEYQNDLPYSTFEYDDKGNIILEKFDFGGFVEYEYDEKSLITRKVTKQGSVNSDIRYDYKFK